MACPELPQSVYDQWADPAVSVITMPKEVYSLAHPTPNVANLFLARSNVTVDFAGCTLLIDPADGTNSGFYPIQIASTTIRTPTYAPPNPSSGINARYISRVSGVISPTTTQLTMHPNEVVNFNIGETVLIWAGVTPSDPVEPQTFIVATVQSVDLATRVVTFAAGLGKTITNYGSIAGLQTATSAGLQWKIGEWGTYPSGANFSKGYGIDHGIERFVGGMVENITFNNGPMMVTSLVPLASAPNAMWQVSAIAVRNLTINDLVIHNPHGNVLHLWRCFGVKVNRPVFTGSGMSKIFNTRQCEAFALAAWGGDDVTYTDVVIAGTDITVLNTEVGTERIVVNGLTYNVTFTSARNAGHSPVILGTTATTGDPRIINARITATTTGGTLHNYTSYDPLVFEDRLTFPGPTLTAVLDLGYQKFHHWHGTIVINNIEYGPVVTASSRHTILHGAGSRTIVVPAGLYISTRVRIISTGDMRAVTDNYGNNYWTPLQGGGWVTLAANHWSVVPKGAANLATYLSKYLKCWLNNAGSLADGEIEVEMTYLPDVKAA
jgi:hypothetical protein